VRGPWGSGSPNENSDFLLSFVEAVNFAFRARGSRGKIFTDIPGSPTTGTHRRK